MKTSWTDTILIEKYLHGGLDPLARQVFKARMLQSPRLRLRMYFQKKAYTLVKLYHRKKLKEEMEILHQQLVSDPAKSGFQQSILRIFQ
ncbi:MAG TPA: hypothetical protein PLE32_16840 [Haliscomenobacter sp.]|nr:hypothetical protein [Haliscomenobacter sp.]